jgi:hypothetical protein
MKMSRANISERMKLAHIEDQIVHMLRKRVYLKSIVD